MAAHYGMLRDYRFSDDVDDIRGAALYGADDDKLGKIDDVIFDHATGTIQYAVVDTGGWLSSKKFLVPADRIRPYGKNDDDFSINATKKEIEALPKYDENAAQPTRSGRSRTRRNARRGAAARSCTRKAAPTASRPKPARLPAGRGSGVDDQAYMPDRLVNQIYQCRSRSEQDSHASFGAGANAEDSRLRAHPSARTFRHSPLKKQKTAPSTIRSRRSAIT